MHPDDTQPEHREPNAPTEEPVEPRRERVRRHGRRAGLYASAFAMVGLVVLVIALAVANTRQVKLDWIFGSTHASLVWIIVVAVVLGWLLGIVMSFAFRLRTRRRRRREAPKTAAAGPREHTGE